MKINRQKLYELYMNDVNAIADEYDWKSTFGPKEIVGMIARIIEEHPEVYETIQKKTTNTYRRCTCGRGRRCAGDGQ